MRFWGIVGLVAVLFALTGFSPAGAHGNVDQMNDGCSASPTSAGNIEVFAPMGQSFKATVSKLFGVDLYLEDGSADGEGTTIRVTIREGTIDGSVVGETTSVVRGGTTDWWHFDFHKKPKLTPGATYVIQLSVDTNPPNPVSHQFLAAMTGSFLNPDPYLDGTRIEKGVPVSGDLCFRTYTNGK